MQLKTSRNNIRQLFNAITNLSQSSGISPKLEYTLIKIKKILKEEVDVVQEIESKIVTEAWTLYEKDRVQLCLKYARKDDSDQPIIENNSYIISEEHQDTFEKEMQDLMDVNKEVIETHVKNIQNFNNFLKEELELDIHKIPLSALENMTNAKPGLVEVLYDLIDEDQ